MRRRLFTLASAASLLLCASTLLIWARSYWITDYLWRRKVQGTFENYDQRTWRATSFGGGLRLEYEHRVHV